nr:AarF/UbiB family protein [Kofleriaceae bacterium]
MVLYTVLAILGALLLLSIVLPVPRRLWAFALVSAKYFWLWVADRIGLRWIAKKLTGQPYEKLSRPALIRMWCEDMGPTFIKFGQIIASSAGMFPDAYVKEFQRVLDRVKPISFDEVKRTLQTELGAEKAAHLTVEPKQLASASIAQVHSAELRDGTKVVIKVQRAGIDKRCESDMKIMRFLAQMVAKFKKDAELANPVGVVEDFAATLMDELDFRKEAANLDRFNQIMAELGHKNIRSPVPHQGYITQKVLVM